MPASPIRVPLSDVTVDEELVDAATSALRSGWWSMGPRVAELERSFAAYVGSSEAIAVANGTAALHLALLSLGIGAGDEVVTPSLTFVAAANAVRLTGAEPVFCDITGDDDLNLDVEAFEKALTERTRAVVVLHYGGFACAIDEIVARAAARGVAVIEDAAHAVGTRIGDRRAGSIGALGCFSFFSNKNLPVGEGGMVVTDDPDLAARVRLLRSHGMTTLTWERHRGHASSYDVQRVGFNYRMDEIRAAMASVQLARLDERNAARAALADRYRDRLHGVAGISLPFAARADRPVSSHHLAVALTPAGVERDAVRASLLGQGIQSSVHYPPIHSFSAYDGATAGALARTDAVAQRLLTLPLYPSLTPEQVDLVADVLIEAVTVT